jgi:hypothetical protein
VRLSEFRTLTREEFGRALADTLVTDLVLGRFDLTAALQRLRGEDPREVWLALCDAMDVPPQRRLGRDRGRRRRAGGAA